jgi:hypothetical protein
MFRSSLAVRAKWQKNCQQQDASSERELRPKSFTWNSDSVNAHLSLPFHTLLLTVLCLYGAILHAAIYDTVIATTEPQTLFGSPDRSIPFCF